MTNKLLPCPFCGGKARIIICDDEGNIHDKDYLRDPYSGLSYSIGHYFNENEDCPISHFDDVSIGISLYSTKNDAIEAWNKRINNG